MAFCLQLIVTVRKIIANIFFRKLTEIRGKMREHYIKKIYISMINNLVYCLFSSKSYVLNTAILVLALNLKSNKKVNDTKKFFY